MLDWIDPWLTTALENSPRILAALAVIAATYAVARVVSWLLDRATRSIFMRQALREVLQMMAAAGIWLGGLLLASVVAFPSITPANVLTVLGLGSVAIGFAFKDIFENFFAGVLILLREPFAVGDHIFAEGVEGAIERISIRDTFVRQTDGQLVVAPNAILFKTPVVVRTNRDLRRTSVICGVAYGEDADVAKKVIEEAVEAVDSVRSDVRRVEVFARAFGASSVDFEIAWWTGSRPIDIRASRDQVLRAVKRALDANGIEIPFPQRVVTVKQGAAIEEAAEPDAQVNRHAAD